MEVRIRAFGVFQKVFKTGTFSIPIRDMETINDLIYFLIKRYPKLQEQLIRDGDLKPEINILVNGVNIRFGSYLDTKITSGDHIAILPPLVGG